MDTDVETPNPLATLNTGLCVYVDALTGEVYMADSSTSTFYDDANKDW